MKFYVFYAPFGVLKVREDGEVEEVRFLDIEGAVESFLNRKNPWNLEEVPEELEQHIRKKIRKIGEEKLGKTKLNELLNRFGIILSKKKISMLDRRDKLIIQVASAISDLDKILNTMSERIREWYGLHYPEFVISSHKKFVETIMEKGRRENFENFEYSVGMEFTEDDEEMVKLYAKRVFELYELREELDKYLERLVKKEMPNLYAILGHIIAAKLLSAAGGLEKLAKLPSSTIQLLGAEKALFRFLRTKGKTKPPKHGIIFLTPYIANAPKDKRGKVARILAAKLAVAARIDYYSKEDKGDELKKDLEEKIKEALGE